MKKYSKSSPIYFSGSAPSCGKMTLISFPDLSTNSARALGLTHIQSMPSGGRQVPFVSIAISNPALCSCSTNSRSIWRRGSPPVQTTNGGQDFVDAAGQVLATARDKSLALANRPPPAPSVPTKDVSQNLQMAVARSFSRPDHRLQPAKRQKTAGRPTFLPSPCKV